MNMFAPKKDSGMTMLEIMLSLGISSFLGVVAFTNLNNQMKMAKYFDNDAEIENIRSLLANKLDCTRTMNFAGGTYTGNPPACSAFIALRDKNGAIFAGTNTTDAKIGNWTINRECQANKGLHIWLTQPVGMSFAKDPLNPNLQFDQNHPRSHIFTGIGALCQSMFNVAAVNANKVPLKMVSDLRPCDITWEPVEQISWTAGNVDTSVTASCDPSLIDNAYCRNIVDRFYYDGTNTRVLKNLMISSNVRICEPSAQDVPDPTWAGHFDFHIRPGCTKTSADMLGGWDKGYYHCENRKWVKQIGYMNAP